MDDLSSSVWSTGHRSAVNVSDGRLFGPSYPSSAISFRDRQYVDGDEAISRRGHPNGPTKSPRQQTRRAASIFKLRWPSGLRRWIKAPVVSAARVRISLLTCLKCYSLCLHKRTVSVVYHEEKCNAVVREDLFQGKTGYLPRASS